MTQLPVLLVTLLLLAGCDSRGSAPPRPRLVILYATCSLNRDTIAPYGDVRYTPNLERFGREALVFERHTTASGQSGTDFATLFSGTQANVHGIYHHPTRLPQAVRLISETFRDGGYETHFWNGHPMASLELGYGQGVEPAHGHEVNGAGRKVILQDGDPDFRALLDELAARPDARAFVLANFTMTHSPYHKGITRREVERFLTSYPEACHGVTPAELDEWIPLYERERLALQWDFPATVERLGLGPERIARLAAVLEVLYRASVTQLDAAFGGLMSALDERGLEDETLICFTADHGELLYRENALFQWTHGLELTPEVLDIPLMIRAPGLAAGTYSAVTRSIDVYPTLAGWCGVSIPTGERPDGVDLSPVLRAEREPPELIAFSHSTTLSAEHLKSFEDFGLVTRYFPRTDPKLMWVRIRRGEHVAKHLNLDGTRFGFQVFDLATDPHETRDLYDPTDPEHREFTRILESYKRTLVEGFESRAQSGLSSEDRLGVLRQLGYVR